MFICDFILILFSINSIFLRLLHFISMSFELIQYSPFLGVILPCVLLISHTRVPNFNSTPGILYQQIYALRISTYVMGRLSGIIFLLPEISFCCKLHQSFCASKHFLFCSSVTTTCQKQTLYYFYYFLNFF